MHKRAGVGQFLAWDGGCLFIGHHDRQLAVHSHQALQIVAARIGHHKVRGGEKDDWRVYSVAGIPSRQPHGLDVTDADYGAVCLIEPETREGRAITHRFLSNGIAEMGDAAVQSAVSAMFDEWLEGDRAETVAHAQSVVRLLAAGVEPPDVTDPRILSAIEYINRHLDRSLTLDEIASHACLSPSHFRHLFSEQTSMGVRPFILWRRFIRVWQLLMEGRTLSEAAHAAGFADAAHLSRTANRNFGFAPSAIQVSQTVPDPATLPLRTPLV